ncbi:MAG: hypothetical protein JW909_04485 [Planctomycetes bacterium]|nr:hypothetical protein [Planctomycetota bacterium]
MKLSGGFLCLVVLVGGCSAVTGRWRVDTETTLQNINTIPEHRKKDFIDLAAYKSVQESWLSSLVLDIKKYEPTELLDFGDFSFIVQGYFSDHPYRAKLKLAAEDSPEFEVWQWMSGPMHVIDGEVLVENDRLVWKQRANGYDIHFVK